MSRFANAVQALKDAKVEHLAASKEELGSVLAGIFESDPGIRDVAWTQKTGEYNDEGLYPGVQGPFINQFSNEDGDIELDDLWSKIYDEHTDGYDEQARLLKTTLEDIGEEVLTEIVGGEEHVVVAYQENGQVKFLSEGCWY